jgi:hypothetical protein
VDNEGVANKPMRFIRRCQTVHNALCGTLNQDSRVSPCYPCWKFLPSRRVPRSGCITLQFDECVLRLQWIYMLDRQIQTTLRRLAKAFPVVAITGSRQSGKTTLARQFFPGLKYVSLEDPAELAFAHEDPRGFLAQSLTRPSVGLLFFRICRAWLTRTGHPVVSFLRVRSSSGCWRGSPNHWPAAWE